MKLKQRVVDVKSIQVFPNFLDKGYCTSFHLLETGNFACRH